MQKKVLISLIVIVSVLFLFLFLYTSQFDWLKKITGNTVSNSYISCSDSDGGNNKYVKGAVTITYLQTNKKKIFSDECYFKGKQLVEYFCDDRGLLRVRWFFCKCEDKACVKS